MPNSTVISVAGQGGVQVFETRKQYSVLTMNTLAFTVNFAIWTMFSVIGIAYGWKFVFQGEIRETFDDNIDSTIETNLNILQILTNPVSAIVAPRAVKLWDFITEPKVGLGIQHEGKTYTLDLIGHFYMQAYSKNYRRFNYYEDATLNYTKELSDAISFKITDVFQHYPEPERFEVLFGNTQEKIQYLRNYAHVDSLFEVNTLYFINMQYTNQYSKYFYTHTNKTYIYDYYSGNYINQELKFSLMHDAIIRHELHWDAANNTYLFYEYEWMNQSPGGITQVHRSGFGYRHDFTKQLYIEGRIAPDFVIPSREIRTVINAYGLQIIIPPGISYPDLKYNLQPFYLNFARRSITPFYASYFAYLTLSNEVDIKTIAKLSFTYQNQVLANSTGTITSWQVLGDVTRYVLPRLSLTSSIFYGQGYYFGQNTLNRLFGLLLTFSYDLTEHVSAFVSYNFTLNFIHVYGYKIIDGIVWNNGGYIREDSGYIRNRASIGVRAEF